MRRSRWLLLALALVLLVLAALVTRCDERDGSTGSGDELGTAREIVYPRQRLKRPRRQQRPMPPPTDGGPAIATRPALPADALERSVLAPGAGGAVFIELNAISQSPLYQKLMRCGGSELSEGLNMAREAFGLDLDRDIDRVAISRDVFAVSGYFSSLRTPEAFGPGQALDARTTLYTVPIEDAAPGEANAQEYVALVDQNLLLSSRDREALQAALQRLDGSAPVDPAPSLERVAGELYGELGPAFVQALLEDDDSPVAQRLRSLLSRATVRVDVDEDVAMSLDVQVQQAEQAQDLARALGGAIAAWRLDAAREGDTELAALLEQARVQPHEDGRFDLDLAVTGAQVLRRLGCDAEGQRLSTDP